MKRMGEYEKHTPFNRGKDRKFCRKVAIGLTATFICISGYCWWQSMYEPHELKNVQGIVQDVYRAKKKGSRGRESYPLYIQLYNDRQLYYIPEKYFFCFSSVRNLCTPKTKVVLYLVPEFGCFSSHRKIAQIRTTDKVVSLWEEICENYRQQALLILVLGIATNIFLWWNAKRTMALSPQKWGNGLKNKGR